MPAVDLPYTVTMLVALATCTVLLRRSQRSLPLAGWQKLGIGVGAFCGAMIGAKLPFVLSDWEGLLSGAAWLSHGKTIMCGIVGGYFGVELAKWALDIRVRTGDTFAVPVAVAVAIGRLACFQAGCCYGTPTSLPWGVAFPTAADDPLAARHPTQLYEAAFHAAAALVLVGLARGGWFRGQLIKLYLLSYLAYRFATEFIRPEARLLWGLTGYQWAALLLAVLFAALWLRDARALKREHLVLQAKVNSDGSPAT
ncbi:MAG: prolipoprotein diacylglyceryl transferase [Pirellulaceae bacterium]|nr:prolipoprotein diacylglyceryl transferase [Pirellulaceae bacterium]